MWRWSLVTSTMLAFLAIAFVGCGPKRTIDESLLANAQASFDGAVKAEAVGQSDEAIRLLDLALQPSAGLSPDVAVEAHILRAIVLARVGRTTDAHADLNIAAEGAGDMSAVHAARAYIFAKEGNEKDSKIEMSKARRLNKRVRRISG